MPTRAGVPTILLVEDNDDDVELIRVALERAEIRCEMEVTYDGSDALEYMFGIGKYSHREISDPPDLVLLDLDLPRVNGHEFLRRIRERDETRLVPVVILTVSAEEYDTVTAYDLGANGYIVKPLDGGGLVETVSSAAKYWLGINEGPATT